MEEIPSWRILVVDDDADNLQIAAEYFEFLGATVQMALSGEKALELLPDFSPDFILADLSMPMMSGFELLSRLRANPATAQLPVIAVTADIMRQDQNQAIEAGFDGYIRKPYLLRSLLADVQAALDAARVRRGQPPAASG